MRKLSTSALAIAAALVSASVNAQDLNAGAVSGSEANSGSISGASADGNQQGQSQANIGGNNAGIGSSESESTSASGAVSGSESFSGAASDQAQGQSQGQTTTNDQGQAQQSSNTNSLGASNEQGVSVSNTFNSTPLRRTYVGTNSAVALAASSSFSSDYCGGTASIGASAAPIGITVGGNKPVFDESCQYLRRAEKFGMAGANYWNMQQPEEALKLMSLMVWSICMSDVRNDSPTPTENACLQMLGSTPSAPPQVYQTPPEVTPEYVAPNADVSPDQNWDDAPHTPRGDASTGEPLALSTQTTTYDTSLFAAAAPQLP